MTANGEQYQAGEKPHDLGPGLLYDPNMQLHLLRPLLGWYIIFIDDTSAYAYWLQVHLCFFKG